MNATERLRQLLDERGVKWEEPDPYQDATAWVGSNNIEYVAHEGISFDGPTGRLILFCLTPEQAVEVTLGRGTCDMEFTKAAQFGDPNDEDSIFDVGMFRCTACGTETYGMWNDNDECREWPRYCPNCGRKVVE